MAVLLIAMAALGPFLTLSEGVCSEQDLFKGNRDCDAYNPSGENGGIEIGSCNLEYRRIVSIADLHGDMNKLMELLVGGGLTDEGGRWVGNDTVLIQTGDMVDRGPQSLEVVKTFMRLKGEAESAGGSVINLLGNHEVLVMDGKTMYCNPQEIQYWGGRKEFLDQTKPGSPIGDFVRSLHIAVVLDNTLYVHGGLTPAMARLEMDKTGRDSALNSIGFKALSQPYSQRTKMQNAVLYGSTSPLWNRVFEVGKKGSYEDLCKVVKETLAICKVERMVIGHNVQNNGQPTFACSGTLIEMDVGMSEAVLDSNPVALEISRTLECTQKISLIAPLKNSSSEHDERLEFRDALEVEGSRPRPKTSSGFWALLAVGWGIMGVYILLVYGWKRQSNH